MSMLKSYSDGFFNVSAEHGFLPISIPLEKLPTRYEKVQEVLDAMPVKLPNGEPGLLGIPNKIEEAVAALPNYIDLVEQETDKQIIQALFRAYSFLTSAFTLELSFQTFRESGNYGKARNILPPQLAQPFVAVADKLEAFPWMDYHYSYSLGNYHKKDKNGNLDWTNLDMCVRFSGQSDESGFIMLHVDINQYSPELVGSVMDTLDAAANNDIHKAEDALDRNMKTLRLMNERRKEMWKASRWQHYNDFRVFIMGVKGNEELFGPGVTYQGVWDEPKQFRGQTGAQDDIIPMEDIFSGVTAYYPQNELTKYLMDLRAYRPKCIQQFFIDLEKSMRDIHPKGLMGYLTDNKSYNGLSRLLAILEEIYFFRNGHWQFVQKYIMANTKYAKATGGTPITSWLPNQIKAVLNQMQDVMNVMDQLNQKGDETSIAIYDSIHKSIEHKRKLLADQLEMVAQAQYSAEKVFELNERYGLKDER
ncbi:MAG: hypothetical protein ACK4V4_09805 [Sphingobacteriales bacterium]|jgi:indoleamine 2,3-dioxygenase